MKTVTHHFQPVLFSVKPHGFLRFQGDSGTPEKAPEPVPASTTHPGNPTTDTFTPNPTLPAADMSAPTSSNTSPIEVSPPSTELPKEASSLSPNPSPQTMVEPGTSAVSTNTTSSAKPEDPFTRRQALEFLIRGQFIDFNNAITDWRQRNPGQYFDLKEVDFAELFESLSVSAMIDADQQQSVELDFRNVDLTGASFRGLKQLKALLTSDGDNGELDAIIDGTRFSTFTHNYLT